MHRAFTLLALVAGLAVAATCAPAVLAAEGDSDKRAAKKQKMIEEFDTDGDGKLSREEKHAARRQKMLEKFDADGDGKLSKEEKKAAREARGQRGSRAGGPPPPPPGPMGDMLNNPEQTFSSHDKNGDGSLSLAEFQAMVQKIKDFGPPPPPRPSASERA